MTDERHNLSRRTVLGAGAAATLIALGGTDSLAVPLPAKSPQSAPAPHRERRFDYVCNECGGNSVTRDGWAEWNTNCQEWVLGAAFDYAYCHDCDQETRLTEVDLQSSAANRGVS